ncbi:hypothetical protein TWF481_003968 [Arthrobotrys musiformis]|uniref:F-box domain-containing protein n=1 Tax=Arthrobotrys musiformis TaxID=47236 RepID=A0AAV9WI81_9PEZI
MPLLSLPNELLNQIIGYIANNDSRPSSITKLCLVCHRFHALALRRLYSNCRIDLVQGRGHRTDDSSFGHLVLFQALGWRNSGWQDKRALIAKDALSSYKKYGELVVSLSIHVTCMMDATSIVPRNFAIDPGTHVTAVEISAFTTPLIVSFPNLTTLSIRNNGNIFPIDANELMDMLVGIFGQCVSLKSLSLSLDIEEHAPKKLKSIIETRGARTRVQPAFAHLKRLWLSVKNFTADGQNRFSEPTGIWLLTWLSIVMPTCGTLEDLSFQATEKTLGRSMISWRGHVERRPITDLSGKKINKLEWNINLPNVLRLDIWGAELSVKVFEEYFTVKREKFEVLRVNYASDFDRDEGSLFRFEGPLQEIYANCSIQILSLLSQSPNLRSVYLGHPRIGHGQNVDWGIVRDTKQVLRRLETLTVYTNDSRVQVEEGTGSAFLSHDVKALKHGRFAFQNTGKWQVVVEF